mgnify:CR=1 FL=1
MPTDKKEYQKEYREANKEKTKEYQKEYYENNKEKNKEYQKEWNETNKEKIKEWREANKEYKKEYDKEFYKTEQGKKSKTIGRWKHRCIKSDDYDKLYEYYINVKNCEECEIELVEGNKSNSRCLDHDHLTNLFRNVLCNSCNVKRK